MYRRKAYRVLAAACLVLLVSSNSSPSAIAAAPDQEDAVTPFSNDVYVIVQGALVTPAGLCRAAPCQPGETLPSEPLFNVFSVPLGLTWGEFLGASASSRVHCNH